MAAPLPSALVSATLGALLGAASGIYVPLLLTWSADRYGLVGEEIPLGARIVAVCDAFDAMTSDRPYRRAMSADAAIEELLRHAGTQFDPEVIAAFQAELADPPRRRR